MSCSPKEAANTSVRLSCSTLIDILFQSRIHWTFSSSVLGTLLTSTPAAPVPKVSTTKAFQMRASPSGTFFHLSFCIHHILPCTIVLGELIFSFSLDYKLAEGRSHVCCLGVPQSGVYSQWPLEGKLRDGWQWASDSDRWILSERIKQSSHLGDIFLTKSGLVFISSKTAILILKISFWALQFLFLALNKNYNQQNYKFYNYVISVPYFK